jgi:UDP-glucose 4-epimerase
MKRVLITGGAGFIGSHLAEQLLKRGDDVYVIDDLSTGALSNIEPLQRNPDYQGRFFFVKDTILNYERMLELVGTCDLIFHLAAAVGVQFIIDHPLESLVTNVRGTEFVLELANKFRKKVVIASTSEVYGKHDHAPLRETDDCVYGSSEKSRWSYAAAKLIDEFAAMAYYRTKKIPVVVVRLFNVVGPRQTGRYGMVLPRFVSQALANKPITVYGDGKQTRTFTHVKEVVDLFMALSECERAHGEVVNLGGVEEVSIFELANRVKKATGSSSEIKLVPYTDVFPKDFEDMLRRVPSTEKLKGLVGRAPTIQLDAIISDVVAAARQS